MDDQPPVRLWLTREQHKDWVRSRFGTNEAQADLEWSFLCRWTITRSTRRRQNDHGEVELLIRVA